MARIIIAEKPNASTKIAEALADGGLKKKGRGGAYWYEFERGGEKVMIVPAVGHIFALDTVKGKAGWGYPTFQTRWIPSFEKKGAEFSKKYYNNIESLAAAHGDSEIIVATDYDTEGSVIGYNIVKFLFNRDNARRMRFSTLTKDELIDSYENRSDRMDMGQVESGLTRHYLDFYWGINMTRALTLAIKSSDYKGFTLLSTGRVQGPTLSMLLKKERLIREFVPKPFWKISADLDIGGEVFEADYEKDKLWDKPEAEQVKDSCSGKAKVSNVEKKEHVQKPPVPFNTTDLQSEAYSHFKYSPKQCLSIVESLYQSGAVSYPRTSSQKLPPSIDYRKILAAISKLKGYGSAAKSVLNSKLVPNEGEKKDPAHPAIYPTFEPPVISNLTAQQRNMYDLIVRRFLAVFSDSAVRESTDVSLDIGGNRFSLSGTVTAKPGWTAVYGKYSRLEERQLPAVRKGDELGVKEVRLEEKKTQPPGRFSQGSILKEMEKAGLGTKATRAEILQTLYDRKYIEGRSIKVTKLGETVASVLEEFCPEILSEDMTKRFEEEMELVYDSKKEREQVLEEAKEVLTKVLSGFKLKEREIGGKLLDGLTESRKDEYSMGKCPECGKELRLIVSKATKKRFVGCSGYPDCRNSFPIPQKGMLLKLPSPCKDCGMQVVEIRRKGRRPYRMCINHKCKSKESWK